MDLNRMLTPWWIEDKLNSAPPKQIVSWKTGNILNTSMIVTIGQGQHLNIYDCDDDFLILKCGMEVTSDTEPYNL